MSIFDSEDQYQRWPTSRFSEPRQVEHGIRLNKTIAEIARNWWSQRWLKILDEFGLGIRWERAKYYVSRGQVISVEIDNGMVRASVQGSSDEPYRVTIVVKTIAKGIWTSIMEDLSRTSAFAISMASGNLPNEEQINQVFRQNGALLFPDRQGELHTKCTCLDWSNPCKHIAAVYLILGAQFDTDPLLLFRLRGLEAHDFFKLAGSKIDLSTDTNVTLGPDNLPADLSQDALKESAQRPFWHVREADEMFLSEWSESQSVAYLPSSLGEFPFWQGKENFLAQIAQRYKTAPTRAEALFVKP